MSFEGLLCSMGLLAMWSCVTCVWH